MEPVLLVEGVGAALSFVPAASYQMMVLLEAAVAESTDATEP